MARILLLLLLIWLVYMVLKRVIGPLLSKQSQVEIKQQAAEKANEKSAEKTEERPEEKIVQCIRCGLHVPESESQLLDQQVVCNNPACQSTTSH